MRKGRDSFLETSAAGEAKLQSAPIVHKLYEQMSHEESIIIFLQCVCMRLEQIRPLCSYVHSRNEDQRAARNAKQK